MCRIPPTPYDHSLAPPERGLITLLMQGTTPTKTLRHARGQLVAMTPLYVLATTSREVAQCTQPI